MSYDPTQPLPSSGWEGRQDRQDYRSQAPTQVYQTQQPRRRRRRRWPWITGIILVIILALLAVADRVANAVAENTMATRIQQQGFPVKPHVSIEGFPFFTQLLAHQFNTVNISATNVPEGPLTISSINATLHGMHINGSLTNSNSATISSINGSALVTFSELAGAGGLPQGITLAQDPGNPNEINANINVGIVQTTLAAKITRVSASKFNVALVSAGDVPTSLLGNLANFDVSIPQLPAGVTINSVSVTQQGVLITITGHNTTLTQ
jgi:hypothetical protein